MTDRDLFIAALDHADPAERAAWLDQACAGDSDRRRRVDILLRAHEHASRFLANPAGPPADSVAPDDPTRTAHPADETSPAATVDVLTFLTPTDKPGVLGKLDHYEVLEVVGRGGMGVVVKAFDPKLHRLVAIKLMAPHLAAHGSARRRFEREARAVAAVKDEHVVAIHQVETEGPVPYLVMEFVGGVSLQDRLERRGPADVKEVLRIGMQTARGLAAAHRQGIVHRDIKPANILLENGVERVKITDFGLARAADDANLTQSGVITGTPNYMSPEQATGAPATVQSDLFSLGSVLYALCTGHPPFRAETPLAVLRRVADDPVRPPREVNPDVPDWLDAIVRKLLAKNPADRFQTATEVADLLGQHLAHLQQPAMVPMPAPVLATGSAPAHPRTTGLGCLLAPLALIGLVLFRDTLYRFYRSEYFAPIDMALSAWFGVTFLRLGRRRATSSANRRVWDLGFVTLAATTVAGLVVWGQDLRRDGPPEWKDWHFSGLLLTLLIGEAALIPWLLARRRARLAAAVGGRSPADEVAAPAPPHAQSPAGFAWLVLIGLVAFPALLFWTHESFWEGYFRPGYVAPVYMLTSSGLLLAVLWWCRRQSEPPWYRRALAAAMAAVVAGTVIGLMVSWGEGTYLDKLGKASNWDSGGIGVAAAIVIASALVRVARWAATHPRAADPAPAGHAAFALGAGYFVVAVGLLASLFVRDVSMPDVAKAHALEVLLGVWVTGGLLAFGPGVFVARRWWRKRLPEERRADGRAAILAGVGLGAMVLAAALVVARTPVLRAELIGPAPPGDPTVVINWDSTLVDRVTLEADRAVLAEGAGPEERLVRMLGAGTYTVHGYKGGREVYAESFPLQPAEQKVVSLFAGAGADGGYLRVACADRGLSVTATGAGHTFAFSHPGHQTMVGQRLRAGEPYQLTIARGADVLHTETVRLKDGEVREFRIPHVARPEHTVELRPKAGSFPSDVVRMRLSPDRSAVAAERFDGPILVFDAATGRERFTVGRPRTHCTAFGFTPSSKHLAYLAPTEDGREHVLRLADALSGEPAGKELQPPADRAFSNSHALAFSPDGRRLAVSSAVNAGSMSGWQSRVLRWEVTGGTEFRERDPLPWQDGMIRQMRFTADGHEVLTVSGAAMAVGRWWDSGTESRLISSPKSATDLVAVGTEHAVVADWTPGSKRAGVGEWPPPGTPQGTRPPPGPPPSRVAFASLAFSPDDRLVAGGTKGLANLPWDQLAAVWVWDRNGGQDRAVLLGHTDWVMDVAFTPDGKELASASKDGTVRTWRLP